ncbi:MAG: hypothetical protein V1707_01455 [bacterium]
MLELPLTMEVGLADKVTDGAVGGDPPSSSPDGEKKPYTEALAVPKECSLAIEAADTANANANSITIPTPYRS